MHSTEKSSWIPPESTGSKQHSHRPAMMSGAPGPRRALPPDQSRSGGSSHTLTPSRQPSHNLDPLPSKRICFYKSGDPQFGGLRMVINRRTFKSFEALLDGLSTKVPLPFGVRNITTPRGLHAVHTLDQLEDGGSYICSDSRKVKPINLALARKKLPPWYNARPGTGRRRAVQVGRMYPGAGKQRRGAGPVVMVHTPRRLTVFRNGEPAGSQTVTLKKRSTQSFEVVLQALSELMQFPVVKLHATDGRRVDGLQALILCSGTVVAAGKEPFKPGNYDVHRSPAPKRPPGTRPGSRKIRPSKRRSRNYSESSQRYFLNQLHNSLSESVFDSNPTDSIELGNSHLLESVVEMDAEPCSDHGTHEQGSCLPTEDDIEKSFRVNEDGSMTVEMKVRLTLKEEETIHWTTTLTRSSVANEPLPDCFPDPEPEQESGSPEHDRSEPSEPALPLETTSSRKPRGDNDDNDQPPPHESGVSGEEGNMEDDVTGKTNHVKSTWRAPTPGVRKAKTSSESASANMAEPVQEGTVRSYSYRAETEQYRMVQQSSTRPVPKPRRLASMDVNYGYGQAEFNSVGMSEVLQIENNGEEVTETMLHVYEQQTCQENYYANTNYRAQGVSVYGNNYGRPSTSDTTWSMNANVEPQFGRPSTASESIPSMRAAISNPCKSLVLNTPQKEFTASKDYYKLLRESGKGKQHQNVADKANKKSSNTKAVKKHVRWIKSPGNRRKQSLTEASKKRTKVKTFSSTGFLKKIYGGRPVKTTMRRKKTATENEKVRPATESSDPPDVTMKCTIKDQYTLSSGDDKLQETIPFESNMLKLSSKTRATQQQLTNQRSIHEERQTHKASSVVNRTLPLPVFNSSNSVNNEYVKHWLENSPSQHALCPGDRTQADKITCQVGLDGGIPEESEVSCLSICSEDKTEKAHTKQTPKNISVPSNAMLHTLSSTSSQTVADRQLTVSHTADQDPLCTDHPKTTSNSSHSEGREEPLSRNSSVKRARLVSNLSFERKMSQRKASVEKSALSKQTTTSSIPIQTADIETLESNKLMKKKEPTAILLERPVNTDCNLDQTSMASRSSYCTSVSPVSPSSNKRVSLSSLASSDASYVAIPASKEHDSTMVKDSDLPLEKKPSTRKAQSEASIISNEPPVKEMPVANSPSLKRTQLDRNPSLKSASNPKPSLDSSKAKTLHRSPSTESPSSLHKTNSQKNTSPYSQSLDVLSSPVKQITKKNVVDKNPFPDTRSEPNNPAPEEPEIPQRNLEPDLLDKIETGISASILNTGLNESKRETLELTNQPNLEPVLEKIVSSIKSIRQRTQKKKPYCLEKSNSLPDFSGHVTTTFGSSSKALLAFLAVMTLKEVLAQEPKCEMDELNPSRAEALKLIDSLREIASIEDSDQLKNSLSELQMSASTQLLQSWKGFQELSKSRRLPTQSEEGLGRRCVDYSGAEEGSIDALMEELDIPKTLKEALAAFPACTPTARDDSVSVEANTPEKPSNDNVTTNSEGNTVNGSDYVQTTKANADREALVDVKAIVKRFTDPGKPQASNEKPANLKQPNLSDDQKVVHTQQITHNGEDSTTDFKDTASLQEEQHPTSAPHVSIEDNQEEDSRNNGKQEEELEQGSLNENQSIKLNVPYMDLEEATEERNEESRCSSESEHLDRELKEIDRNSEDSMFSPEEMFSPEVESSSDEEQKHILSTEGRHGNICNPKTQQKLPSPQEPQDVVLRHLKQVRNNPMSDYKSLSSSEEEEQKLQRTNRFKRLGVNISSTHETSRQDVEDQTSSEDDQHVDVQQLGRTHTKPVHVFPHIDKQIRRKLTKIESLSERSEESVSTPDAEELGKLEKVQPQVQKLEPQEQLSCTEAMTKPVCKAVNQEQRVHGKLSAEDTSCQRAPPQKKAQPAEIISQSVAERIGLLKQQVAETQWKSKTAGGASIRIPADEAPLKVESSTPDTKTTQPLPGFRSAPHSSLSFSYESNGVINRQPEGANVRSIKDMFMAKSLPDVQREEADVHGPIRSEASPASQSQDPFELSEAASIAKGFVRRTIERLYGRKDPTAADTPSKRSTSSPKPKIESFSIFSSLPSARSKQRSDMAYFNSTNTLHTLGGVTRCMAFNTQVVPDNSLPMNQDRTLHHKTYSDQVEINEAAETPLPDGDLPDDGKQTVPVSPISRNPDPVDKLALTRCTYFSLPCTSDSEPGPEDPGAMGMNAESIVDIKEDQEEAKGLVADHGPLPGLRLHDNKVHPLTQGAPGGSVVVVQPVRAQRVAPRPVELDALDALYTFCGQHCPIL
ncbi:uncharacterized protein LOC132452473 [Gadus macrocephalus]|uniref:uncharacterized protein LOC132452473 n=1 Tax=Gadus macrocephalus TaxID=80720 RepID=UPI0028CB533F|nr:uncharacterized protein LOC132452473 [Gadus macrocephalus]